MLPNLPKTGRLVACEMQARNWSLRRNAVPAWCRFAWPGRRPPAGDASGAGERLHIRLCRLSADAYSGPIFGDGFRFSGQWHALGRNVPT